MNLERFLNQKITYWAFSSKDGFGAVTYDTPTTINGRWEDKQELFINSNAEEQRSQAIVYLNQDVTLEGYLYLGTSTETDPVDVSEAKEINAVDKSPSIDGKTFLRKIWL